MSGTTEPRPKVLTTTDDKDEAVAMADRLWREGARRAGVEEVLVWNRLYPDAPLRTVNRFLVYEVGAG